MRAASAQARVKVCIDFGTTFSGFTFSCSDLDESKIYEFDNWPGWNEAGQAVYAKTPTLSLYSAQGEFLAYGWEALLQYKERVRDLKNAPSKGDGPVHLIEKIKLHLSPKKRRAAQRLKPLPASLSAQNVIADYLRALGERCLTEIKNSIGSFITESDVQWCITVPAIWDDSGKALMCEALQLAGLVCGPLCNTGSKHEVICVLEPEAASLACTKELQAFASSVHKPYIVADIGGGTVDIVVHQIDQTTGKIKEIACGTGDLAGGTFIDKEFRKHLASKVGEAALSQFERESPLKYIKLMGEWERCKRAFNGRNGTVIDVPRDLQKIWMKHCKDDVDVEEIELTAEAIKSFFKPTADTVIRLVRAKLKECSHMSCDTILLVGGPAGNKYLNGMLIEHFAGKTVITPNAPGSVVVKGGTLYALKPKQIVSRKCRKTYGKNTRIPFVEGQHKESKRVWCSDEQKYFCDDCFSVFATKGQDVPEDMQVTKTYYPAKITQTAVTVTIFTSERADPEYTDDPGCEKIGTVRIDLGGPAGMNRELVTSMYFGKTMIQVKVVDSKTGNFAKTQVKLLA